MKNFLAIDTSGNYLTVLAGKGERTFSVSLTDCAMRHSVNVMPAVEEVLQKADMTLADCDFFAAVVGAGSFTGIRIGISVVKGFCLAYQKPALSVTTFDVAAYTAVDGNKKTLCLVDALHDCYYACGYEGESIVYSPAYVTEAEVLALQKEGYTLRALGKLPLQAEVTEIDPVSGLENAVRALSEKGAFGELRALYVRKSSAELNLGK